MDNNEPWEIAKMGNIVSEYPYSYKYLTTVTANNFVLRIVKTEDSKILYVVSRWHNPNTEMIQEYSLEWSDEEIIKDQYENIFNNYFSYEGTRLYNPYKDN